MKKNFRGSGLPLLLLLAIAALVLLMFSPFASSARGQRQDLVVGDFVEKLKENTIAAVIFVKPDVVYGIYTDTEVNQVEFIQNKNYQNYDFRIIVNNQDAFEATVVTVRAEMLELDPQVITEDKYGFSYLTSELQKPNIFIEVLLPNILFVLVLGGLMLFLFRRQDGANNKTFTFGKSRAQLYVGDKNKTTFEHVAGADEEKEDLKEIVDFLKDPKRFLELGARIPKGVLLVGPPGTGKTLLAKAVAGEAGVPFFSISGSDFVEMFVGVGASRVRDLFEQAKRNAPCIIFIDEIDAVGRQRGAGMGGGHDEREQTLNQLLIEMDGFTTNQGIIILAATNRPDILDSALLRPGRFDRQVTVNYPDVKGREEILRVHTKNKPLAPDVDLKVLAKLTPMFTGADLENVANEGAILAARRKHKAVTMLDLRDAISRVTMGPEKRSKVVTEIDKKLVAYHEGGHAVLAHMLPHTDPVHEVSIIPRGRAGGYTYTLEKEETQYLTKTKLSEEIIVFLGGRVAEQLIMGDMSTGAQSDLKRASEMVRRMITEYGMSDVVGPVYLGNSHEVFLGRDFSAHRGYSEEVAAKVDNEITHVLNDAHDKAEKLLKENVESLHRVAEALLKYEKLDGEQFRRVMNNLPVEDAEAAPQAVPTANVNKEDKEERKDLPH